MSSVRNGDDVVDRVVVAHAQGAAYHVGGEGGAGADYGGGVGSECDGTGGVEGWGNQLAFQHQPVPEAAI